MNARPEFFILSEDDVPIPVSSFLEWWVWIEANRLRESVRQEQVGEYRVSTMFLGLDHNLLDVGPPHIFETMIFPQDETTDGYQERYSTRELALEGHRRAVDWIREKTKVLQ